jgi:uncharacterized RDD family membrane protein YckC
MSAREIKQITALLVSFWTALLILVLMAPLSLALAAEPPSDPSVAGQVTGQVREHVLANAVAKAKKQAAAEAAAAADEAVAAGSAAQADAGATEAASAAADDENEDADTQGSQHKRRPHVHGSGDDVVSVGHDAELRSDSKADSVVSIGGEARSAGAAGDVVSVFGSTRVTGPASGDAVAVLGDAYVDSVVKGDVVGVLGDVELGPHADIGGQVVSVLGTIKRDPAAVVHHGSQMVGGGHLSFGWLHSWLRHCAILGRSLAFDAGVSWAWALALGFLALYVLLALLFPRAIEGCLSTLEAEPRRTVLASFLLIFLVPVALLLLAITGVGLLALPFVLIAMFCAALFGKAALLAWVGYRLLGANRSGPLTHPASAVLVGGVLVTVAYVVPLLGFIVWNALALLSVGLITMTLLKRAQGRGEPTVPPEARATNPPSAAASAPPTASAAGTEAPFIYTATSETTERDMNTATDQLGGAPGATPGAAGTPPSGAAPAQSRRIDPALAATLPRAGFWMRIGALFLDVLLVGFVAGMLRHEHSLFFVLLATYGAVMWKLRGATVGDIVFDLQVARVDGRALDWETCIVRALGCFLSLFVVFLGFFWIAFDPAKQAWHDKIAGTVVVRVPKALPSAA